MKNEFVNKKIAVKHLPITTGLRSIWRRPTISKIDINLTLETGGSGLDYTGQAMP